MRRKKGPPARKSTPNRRTRASGDTPPPPTRLNRHIHFRYYILEYCRLIITEMPYRTRVSGGHQRRRHGTFARNISRGRPRKQSQGASSLYKERRWTTTTEATCSRGEVDGAVPPKPGKTSKRTPGLPPFVRRHPNPARRILRGTRRARKDHTDNA